MKKLYILFHLFTFIAGWWDNGNITVFGILIVIDICLLLNRRYGESVCFKKICDYIRK